MRLVTVKKCFVKGSQNDFKGKTQNTSYIERFNLTLRLLFGLISMTITIDAHIKAQGSQLHNLACHGAKQNGDIEHRPWLLG